MRQPVIYRPLQRLSYSLLVSMLAALLVSCETLAPLALGFGKSLLTTAAHNHSPQYAELLKDLLVAFSEKKASSSAEPAPAEPAPVEASGQSPIALDVAILAQRMSGNRRAAPMPIQDGATLRDGRGNPAAGDTLKISFKANCTCFVYIVAIDASGFAEPVFPSTDLPYSNPVQQNRQYVVPQGTVWYGLDEYRGIENIYLVASYTRRDDLEEIINQLASKERGTAAKYRSVTEAAVIPDTRGLVKVQLGEPGRIQAESGQTYAVTPTTFLSTISGVDLVITRWFNHM